MTQRQTRPLRSPLKRRILITLGLFVIAFGLSPVASVQGQARAGQPLRSPRAERISLNWVRATGAETCLSPSELATQVEGLLGTVFVPPSQADATIEAWVERVEGGFEAHITMRRANGVQVGERVLNVSGSSCAPLAAQTALVVAITVDPDIALPASSATRVESAPADETPKPSLTLDAPTLRPASEGAEMPRAPWWSLTGSRARFGVGPELGALPEAALSMVAAHAWQFPWFGVEASLGALLPRNLHYRDYQVAVYDYSGAEPVVLGYNNERGAKFRASSLRARAGVCHRPVGESISARFWVYSCLSASFSYYFSAYDGKTPWDLEKRSLINAGGYVVSAVRVLPHISIGLELELEGNFRRANFRQANEPLFSKDAGSFSPVRFGGLLGVIYDY